MALAARREIFSTQSGVSPIGASHCQFCAAIESGPETRMTTGLDAGDWYCLALGVGWFFAAGADTWRRKHTGPVLLDLGRVDGHVIYLLAGILVEVSSIYGLFFWRQKMLFPSLFFLGWGLSLITYAQNRFQIRESGLFGGGRRMIRWKKITGYQISPIGALSVKLQSGGWRFFCDVVPAARSDAARILALKYPECATTGT